jgi:hypothetical protein
VNAVKRVGEVGQGICGGDGAGAGAEGCYRASMDDGWRVCIAFGGRGQLKSCQEALISALGSRLGDQVAVSSSRWGTQIFLYAPSAGSADEAEQQARHEARQERERQASVTSGRPAREVWVELPSHDDVVHLAGHLAARGWPVRPHRRHLIVGAACEDDAKSLARELTGDGRADADTAFRVRRVGRLDINMATRKKHTPEQAGPG